ncbi:ArsR/SmtB family transcription factor [Agrococcus carbonis]|uniref:DNA-binding transcriptional regulator, ArsR family n=1 Tax=Agrococcus carbonis TaxID=684552 RepID=A0A1H1Q3B7_9MICO|nr:metalloregulator ArsR/SmtB family transcription factor [Agrococcus carbonis]SDS17925.1 DNA-binding transcriptional regulator, ArsR family [Agrococcus carbonis]
MHALDVLGDPVRRRILELLTDGEASAGAIAAVIGDEFGISQPAVSQHLRVLREQGFATVRPEGQRRLYAVDPEGPRQAREWLSAFDGFWMPKLAALDTELARGRRQRRLQAEARAAADARSAPGGAAERTTEDAAAARADASAAHDDTDGEGFGPAETREEE